MGKKYYYIIGIIILIGIFLIIDYMKTPSQTINEGDVIDPKVSLQATILSIDIRTVCPVDEDPCPVDMIFDDWVEIQIDEIIEYQGEWWKDPRVNYEPLNVSDIKKVNIYPDNNKRTLKEGDKIKFTSTYSANQLIIGEYELIS